MARRSASPSRIVCGLVPALIAAALMAPQALASPSQESIIMDDAKIVFSAPDKLEETLTEMRSLGVDRVRVSVLWKIVAPGADSRTRPAFGAAGAAHPAGYPADLWDRYDNIVEAAERAGIGVLFSITGPAPLWATGESPRADIAETYEPSPNDFRDFVTAVGLRYSGTYHDEVADVEDDDGDGGLLPGSGSGSQQSQPEGPLLPRVEAWSIWNEPNHPGWLTPSWLPDPRGGRRKPLAAAPRIYRSLVDAAWSGLEASGHAGDLVMLGETAPRGLSDRRLTRPIRPLEFIRELYCLDRRFRPMRGSNAEARGCPGSAEAFVQQHPGLFLSPAWAHHPYALDQRPSDGDRDRDNVVLADLDRLTTTLDRIFAVHGRSEQLPIWLTEYGYQTNPPDPTLGVSWARHAAYLNEADYIAYRNRRVASTAQFLLFDDGPLRQFDTDDPRHWGTFQSGLKTNEGARKTAYIAYQRPIHVTPSRVRRGRTVRVWGQLRRARGEAVNATVEFRARRSRTWKRAATASSRNPRGFVSKRVRPRRSGWYRIVFTDASGARETSRRTYVRIVPKRRSRR